MSCPFLFLWRILHVILGSYQLWCPVAPTLCHLHGMHWISGSHRLAIQRLSFQPRDWSMDGHVTQTRPICVYPETNSWTLEKTGLPWSIGLLVPILHLSLGPHPFPCNFAVLPLDFRLGHVAFGQWDISKHDASRGLKYLCSRLALWYLCFWLEKSFLRQLLPLHPKLKKEHTWNRAGPQAEAESSQSTLKLLRNQCFLLYAVENWGCSSAFFFKSNN